MSLAPADVDEVLESWKRTSIPRLGRGVICIRQSGMMWGQGGYRVLSPDVELHAPQSARKRFKPSQCSMHTSISKFLSLFFQKIYSTVLPLESCSRSKIAESSSSDSSSSALYKKNCTKMPISKIRVPKLPSNHDRFTKM